MRLRFCGLLAGGLLPAAALAQTTPAQPTPVLTPGRLLVPQGVALHDKEEYQQAADRYRQVLPGDSAYAGAQSELALSLMSAGKYQESLEAVKLAVKLEPFEPHTYATMANDYEGLKQLAEARQAYAAGIKLFPYNENLWVNQGILELNQKQLAPALVSLERAIELRPGKASGHRLLGKAALQQGQLAHAMTSMLVSLAIEPDGPRSQGVLVDLEKLSVGEVVEPANQLAPVVSNAAFEELDQLITAKVALTASYTSKVKFKAGIVKQLQLLVEKFPVDADPATDFWVRAYAPLMRVLRQDDNLTTFTYLILSSADTKTAAQWVKSNKGKVEQLATALSGPLLSLRSRQPLAGTTAPVPAWFGEGGILQGLGPGERDAKGELQPSGDWVLVGRNGSLSERGAFDASHKRTGKWLDLRPDGTVQTEATYAAGDLEGPARTFYPSGQLRSESTYRAGKTEGTSKTYAEDGHLTQTRQLVKGDYEGEAVDYYPDKSVSFRVTMHADQKNGVMERFYPDGTLRQHEQYVAGKGQGEQLEYYPNKTVQRKGTFDQGEPHGSYTSYFANGKMQEVGQYTRGKRTGNWKEYFSNGQLSVEKNYDATGELHGDYHDYDYQGHHYADSQYEHGRLVHSASLDAKGQPRPGADYTVKKARTVLKSYDAEGRLNGEGPVENGALAGEWKTYYPDGTVRGILHYGAGGVRQGVSETFYTNGQLHQRRSYNAKGEQEGYLEQFTPDGQLQQTGYEIAGQDAGTWKTYFADGKLSHEREVHYDEPSGPMRSLTPTGQVSDTKQYRYGQLKQVIDYDSTGRVVSQQDVTPAVRELVAYFPGIAPQQVMTRSAVLNGVYEGPITWLWPGGKPETTLAMHDGRRYGPYRRYYPSGQLEMESTYLNGQYYGAFTSYYADGTPNQKGTYLAGEAVGEWTTYFANGKVQEVEHYNDDGELDGALRFYNPAGELLIERRYEQGRLVGWAGPGATADATAAPQVLPPAGGLVETKFANGKPAVSETFARDYHSGSLTYYYASGQVYRRASYDKSRLSGPVVCYWPSGKPMLEENYQHGERHGRCRYYRPDGTLEREQSYRQGERHGPWTYYDAQGKPQHHYAFWNDAVYSGQ